MWYLKNSSEVLPVGTRDGLLVVDRGSMGCGMGRRHTAYVAVGVVVGAGIVAAVALLVVSAPTVPQPASGSANRARAARPVGCVDRLLKDWNDGRIDGTYRLACYRKAIKELPLDLVVYSSAADDIRQALSERIVQGAR
jgi:hypothetical protein